MTVRATKWKRPLSTVVISITLLKPSRGGVSASVRYCGCGCQKNRPCTDLLAKANLNQFEPPALSDFHPVCRTNRFSIPYSASNTRHRLLATGIRRTGPRVSENTSCGLRYEPSSYATIRFTPSGVRSTRSIDGAARSTLPWCRVPSSVAFSRPPYSVAGNEARISTVPVCTSIPVIRPLREFSFAIDMPANSTGNDCVDNSEAGSAVSPTPANIGGINDFCNREFYSLRQLFEPPLCPLLLNNLDHT
jgi:hypothetical protein